MKFNKEKKSIIVEEPSVGTIFDEEEIDVIRKVLQSGTTLTRGPEVDLFEEEFARYCGAKYAISVSSCGAALHLSSKILQLNEGDEVICQGNSFWVTFNHLLQRKVKIVCADIDSDTLNIHPDKIEPLIREKTKAIYITHHGGNPADLDPIRSIAKKYNLIIVEDCAHAVGAEYKKRKIGSDSDIACFSFSTLKNMSTLGEGGMIVTNNEKIANSAKDFRSNFPLGEKIKKSKPGIGIYPKSESNIFLHMGDSWDYDWSRLDEMGTTYRLSAIQAAVGRVQLKKLDVHIRKREYIARKYNEAIDSIDELKSIKILPEAKHAWHLFSFFVKSSCFDRFLFAKTMTEKYKVSIIDRKNKINTRFSPINLGGLLRMQGCNVGGCKRCIGLENAERIWFKEQLSLPISPQLNDEQIQHVVNSLANVSNEMKNLD